MAVRGRNRSNTIAASRDPLRSLSSWMSTPQLAPVTDLDVSIGRLRDVEDGRIWNPDPERGAVTVGGRWARVVVHRRPFVARANTLLSASAYPVGFQVPVGVQFETPLKVVTCLRRKIRRQIAFAKRFAGSGVKKRRPRRSWRSNVSC